MKGVIENVNCSPDGVWNDIPEAKGTPYEIMSRSNYLVEGNRFRAKATYDDGQGYPEVVYSAGLVYTTRPAVRIRAKVFLEGSLQ